MTDQRDMFDGPHYVPDRDNKRLRRQVERVYYCMRDGRWRTLEEISKKTGDPQASISAQLRHLRKRRYGKHRVRTQQRGEVHGLFEYKLIPSPCGLLDGQKDGPSDRVKALRALRRYLEEGRVPPHLEPHVREVVYVG